MEHGGRHEKIGSLLAHSLAHLSLADLSPGGLTKTNLGLIQNNPNLTSIALGSLRELGRLSINGNTSLSEIAADALDQVSFLQVTHNPQLSPDVFDGVQTLGRDVHDNAA